MHRTLLIIIGVVSAVFIVLMLFAVAILPDWVALLLGSIPAKYLLAQIGLLLIAIAAIFAYWTLQVPRTAQVALGLMRACVGIAVSSTTAPLTLFGMKNLSIAVNRASVNVTLDTSIKPLLNVGIIALIVAYFSFREYRSVMVYRFENGLSEDI